MTKTACVFLSLLLSGNLMAAPTAPAAKPPEKPDPFVIQGSIKKSYKDSADKVIVPGFITTKPQLNIATIIGPLKDNTSYLISDKIYLRWDGSPAPRVGDFYSIFSPAIVVQSKEDASDFRVIADQGKPSEIPEAFRLAGYFYEPNGELLIKEVQNGLVTAIITHAAKTINLGDQLMLPMPQFESIGPIRGGLELSAVIVAGSPPETILPFLGTFVYLNRGSRDGVKIGQIFEAVEQVKLAGSPAVAPTESLGELKVVYTTEFYSTALVTKHFDTIRLGGVVQTTRVHKQHDPAEKFIISQKHGASLNLNTGKQHATRTQKLSELDELERRAGVMSLSPEERERLNLLQTQSLKKSKSESEEDLPNLDSPDADVPALPQAPKGSVKAAPSGGLKTKKKDSKKKKPGQDEASLNELMQF